MSSELSIVIPAKNEAGSIADVVARLRQQWPDAEILVVDDGSDDDTGAVARQAGARVHRHPESRGNGAAIKSGARQAKGRMLMFMDADGQHDPADGARLLEKLADGYDLAIGARRPSSQASWGRRLANALYNRLASWVVGHRVEDLTSGYRAVDADKFREFLHLYPNGFSYPTTSTMCFYRSGYGVAYVDITAGKREGKGHIRLLYDGGRFLLIIFRIGTLYAPLKLYFPLTAALFSSGLVYSAFTLLQIGRFTNFGALLFLASLLTFLIGLVSEQITQLLFAQKGR